MSGMEALATRVASKSEMDDLVIDLFAVRELAHLDRIAALEDEVRALRALAQSRGDDAATFKVMLLQAWALIYQVDGYWQRVHHPTVAERNAS